MKARTARLDDRAEKVVAVLGDCFAVMAGFVIVQKFPTQVVNELDQLFGLPLVFALVAVNGVAAVEKQFPDRAAFAVNVRAARFRCWCWCSRLSLQQFIQQSLDLFLDGQDVSNGLLERARRLASPSVPHHAKKVTKYTSRKAWSKNN